MGDRSAAKAFLMEVTVGEEDIDGLGHASNVAVVGWMSEAAWRHSQALGWDLAAYRRTGGVFVVRRHEVDYRAQAVEGETLLCRTWPSGLGKATAERRHRIERVGDGAMIAEGLNVWAYVDLATGRPRRIPPELRETFDPARFA